MSKILHRRIRLRPELFKTVLFKRVLFKTGSLEMLSLKRSAARKGPNRPGLAIGNATDGAVIFSFRPLL